MIDTDPAATPFFEVPIIELKKAFIVPILDFFIIPYGNATLGSTRAVAETQNSMIHSGRRRDLSTTMFFTVFFMVLGFGATCNATADGNPTGPSKERANSYDAGWRDGPTGWVANVAAMVAGATGKTEGFTLFLGDSLTRGPGLAAWAQNGEGKTAEDVMITEWMHASTDPIDFDSKDGFGLATPYICSARSYTVGDSLGAWDLMSEWMPTATSQAEARQLLADCATYPNGLNIRTIVMAFPDAQFAIPEYNLDANNVSDVSVFESLLDVLIANGVIPIIITYTYRTDDPFNLLVDGYNDALYALAEAKKLPLVDLNNEMLLRTPFEELPSGFSSWEATFLSDGVHYTNGGGGYTSIASPYIDGGDPVTHTTGEAMLYNGYGLKAWLSIQKMKQIKELVFDPLAGTTPMPPSNLTIQ